MTLLDERPTRDRPPHRTWRDLPASPPVGPVPAGPPPGTVVVPPEPGIWTDPTSPLNVASPAGFDTALPPIVHQTAPRMPRRGRRIAVIVGCVVALAAITGGIVMARADDGGPSSSGITPTLPSGSTNSASDVAAALGPAVVQIEIAGGLDAGGGVGSGVIYDASGLVLTAHHVVATSDEVTVRLADNTELNGRVVGRLPEKDLAVVALDGATDLTAATIAEPGSVEVGEPAIALGSPFGYQASVTAGIISGLDRELETPVGVLTGLIQTDAPINPGNSGGPLADSDAKVIGINTAIASMSGGNDGVGFAVPVEQFTELLDQVDAAGGVDAPTIPAPEGSGGLGEIIPGLDDLIPGLDDLIPGLDEIIPGGELPAVPDLADLLAQLFGDNIPQPIKDLLDDLLGGGQG